MGIGAALGSAVIGAVGSSKAAKAQTKAATQQMELQREIYEDQKALFNPFYNDGLAYAGVRNFLDGVGPRPTFGGTAPQIETISTPASAQPGFSYAPPGTGWQYEASGVTRAPAQPTTQYRVGGQTFGTMDEAQNWANANKTGGTPYAGMQETDAYKFRVNQGVKAIDAGAAARGGLYSGKTMQDLQTYGQGQAAQFENDYYNRIAGGAAQGQAAAGQTAQAGQNYATGASNALANIGNAQAAGAIGIGNALQGGIGNAVGLFQYQNQLNGGNAGLFSKPWGSSGFWG